MKLITIDVEQVKRFMGYQFKPCPRIIERKILEEIHTAPKFFQPHIAWQRFSLQAVDQTSVCFGGHIIRSNYVASQLANAHSVCVAIYTLGNCIEEKIQEYSQHGEMIRAMILDKIGIVALDELNRQMRDNMAHDIAPYVISAQLFPAQKDFDISYQRLIYDILKKDLSMVQISQHHQFYPIKTVAVILGIGTCPDPLTMCDRCDKKCHSPLFLK